MGGFPQRRDRSATAAVQRGGGKNDGFMDELHFYKVGSPRHPGKNSCKLLAFCSEWGGFYANYNLLFLLLLHTYSHCSYLDIYISRKIRLCVVDFEGKFQANLQAKLFISLVWKFNSIIIIFLLFIAEFVKYSAFYTLMLLFQRVDIFELQFLPDVSWNVNA